MPKFNPVIPNQASAKDIHEYLLKRATHNLRSTAGYIAPTMTAAPDFFQTMDKNFAAATDKIMTTLCGETIKDCNPHIPYFIILKILVDDYEEAADYVQVDKWLIYHAFVVLLKIIAGTNIEYQQLVKMTQSTVEIIEKNANGILGDIMQFVDTLDKYSTQQMITQQIDWLQSNWQQMVMARRIMLLSSLLIFCSRNSGRKVEIATDSYLKAMKINARDNIQEVARTLCYIDDIEFFSKGLLRSICLRLLTNTGTP